MSARPHHPKRYRINTDVGQAVHDAIAVYHKRREAEIPGSKLSRRAIERELILRGLAQAGIPIVPEPSAGDESSTPE